MIWSIYIATNKVNGHQYVGMTVDFKSRKRHHLGAKYSGALYLSRAVKKYGSDAFVIEEVAMCQSLEDAVYVEQLLIKDYGTRSPGGTYAGSFLCTGTAGASTQVINMPAAAHGWVCQGGDVTSGVAWAQGVPISTTSAKLTGTIATTSDAVNFECTGY